ncbi:MAG: hypothetical protein PHU23_08765 [Dehalococcoidales bacterium]|nr:hypothetical protein [Dehalococcoidales bacterium]
MASILQDLKDSYVVLADLTDRNANVFYELGVRHSLKDRTILLAQKQEDIPFDLIAYAYHVYDWKTEEGKQALAKRLAELLTEIDSKPERPDNPVSDFLGRTEPQNLAPSATPVQPREVIFAQSLAGDSAAGVNAVEFARRLARENTPQAANTVYRLTKNSLLPEIQKAVNDLNQKDIPNQIPEDQILDKARGYISVVEPQTKKVEEFVLASVEEQWIPGVRLGLRLSGNLISLTERPHSGRSVKFAQGTPELLAWRLLLISGAKALSEEAFPVLGYILKEPIEVEDHNGRFSNLNLIKRRDLFWPEALLGNAYTGAKYLVELWNAIPHLHTFFSSEEEYQFDLAKFYMVAALATPTDGLGHPLYPGYRLFPGARRAMSSLHSRLVNSDSYLEGIAQALGETPAQFRENWPERVRRLNDTESGVRHPWLEQLRFPIALSEEKTEL